MPLITSIVYLKTGQTNGNIYNKYWLPLASKWMWFCLFMYIYIHYVSYAPKIMLNEWIYHQMDQINNVANLALVYVYNTATPWRFYFYNVIFLSLALSLSFITFSLILAWMVNCICDRLIQLAKLSRQSSLQIWVACLYCLLFLITVSRLWWHYQTIPTNGQTDKLIAIHTNIEQSYTAPYKQILFLLHSDICCWQCGIWQILPRNNSFAPN